jgi:hypothetical protein
MTSCFAWILLPAMLILTMVSMIRWFEQVTEAVDLGWWNKVFLLVMAPPVVWMFESKIAAGRPSAFPRHEPVRGFGIQPPAPGEKPKIPTPPPKKKKPPFDPSAVEKLRQKMREQGMLDQPKKETDSEKDE